MGGSHWLPQANKKYIYLLCVGPIDCHKSLVTRFCVWQPLHATRLQWLGWVCVAPHALPQHHSWLCGTTSVVKISDVAISSCSLVLKSGRCSWTSCDRLRCQKAGVAQMGMQSYVEEFMFIWGCSFRNDPLYRWLPVHVANWFGRHEMLQLTGFRTMIYNLPINVKSILTIFQFAFLYLLSSQCQRRELQIHRSALTYHHSHCHGLLSRIVLPATLDPHIW